MAVSWRTSAFQKKGPETPIFIVFFGCALSGPRCQKREILKKHPKKRKIWLIIEKLFFGVFAVFFGGLLFFLFFFLFFFLLFFCFFVFLFFLFFCFFVFFWGFKGQVRWPEEPPHLALNPPSVLVFFFCFVFFCFVWRVKGQVRWPKGPPHLTLNPPYLFLLLFCFVFCFWFFGFVFWLFNTKKPCFPPLKRAFFVYFQCFSFFPP